MIIANHKGKERGWKDNIGHVNFKLFQHAGTLPVAIDFVHYDHDSGYHNITIIANSTMGEVADYTYVFFVPGVHIT